MNKTDKRQYYLKKLYYNAGKGISDEINRYIQHYINYKYLNSIIMSISASAQHNLYVLNDKFGAFFNTLCRKIINELYYYDTVIIVMDPHLSENIACQAYFIDNKLSILNAIYPYSKCKDINLYSELSAEKADRINIIAIEFFKKAYKYN